MKLTHWAAGLAVLQVADLYTTWLALSAGAEETNKIVLWLGWPMAAALKGALAVTIILGAHHGGVHRHPLQLTVVLYAAVCVLNVMAWQQAKVA